MLATMPFVEQIGFDRSLVVGYTTMVLAFLLVFFGIRAYRENVGGGFITFGRAFKVGILIVLISSVCYVITWEFVYHTWLPDFPDKYANHLLEKARASGASAEEIAAQAEQIKNMRWIFENPFLNAAIAFLEPLPVGLIMTLISSVILKKRRPEEINGPEQLEQRTA